MLYNIRLYKNEDLSMLKDWNNAYGEPSPTEDMIPIDSSFILEIDKIPALFISLLCTNSKYAYLENYCGNPEFKGKRMEAVQHLIKHLEETAKNKGYKTLVTFGYKPKLIRQFQNYGFIKTIDGLSAFIREVK